MVPLSGESQLTQVSFEVVIPPVQTQFISTLVQLLLETLLLMKFSFAEKQK